MMYMMYIRGDWPISYHWSFSIFPETLKKPECFCFFFCFFFWQGRMGEVKRTVTWNRLIGHVVVLQAYMMYTGDICFFKVSNRKTRKRSEICSKLTIKTPERCHWPHSGVFIVNLEHISHLLLCVSIVESEQEKGSWEYNWILLPGENLRSLKCLKNLFPFL